MYGDYVWYCGTPGKHKTLDKSKMYVSNGLTSLLSTEYSMQELILDALTSYIDIKMVMKELSYIYRQRSHACRHMTGVYG